MSKVEKCCKQNPAVGVWRGVEGGEEQDSMEVKERGKPRNGAWIVWWGEPEASTQESSENHLHGESGDR